MASASADATASQTAKTWPRCDETGIVVQVIGSGGPIAEEDGRKSASYLVWIDGVARVIVDLGQGATHGFGLSGASHNALDAILLSHLHADHSSDLAAFVKSASFHRRPRPLIVVGPSGNDTFPSVEDYLQALLGQQGIFRYLKATQSGADFTVTARVIDATVGGPPAAVALAEDLEVRAVGVEHGPAPTLAYGLETGGRKIVFMGDQDVQSAPFAELLRDADLFVAHMAVGQGPGSESKNVHASPAQLGQVADTAKVKRMVLSHLMQRSLRDLEGNLQAIQRSYQGPLTVARDGLCVSLP